MKHFSILSGIVLALLMAAPAFADSTTSGLTPGGTIQTQDQIPVYRPSNPGTNFRVSVGSAATQSIGTSGPAVPLMSTANTWSASQSFISGDLNAADPVFSGGSIQVPVGNTSLRPSSAINGMIRYNTDTPGIEAYVNGAWGSIGGSMVYPPSGISVSTGTAWGTSLAVGTTANDLLQLNGSGQLPAVSAANLINFPTFNQNTTGNANTATALAATPTQCTVSGQFSTGIQANGTANCATPASSGGGITALTGDVAASGTGSVAATIAATTVSGKALTGFSSAPGTVSATDTILSAFNKLVGNIAALLPSASPTFTGTMSGVNETLSGASSATGGYTGNLAGNASGTASNVTGVVSVAHGGSNATTPSAALSNLAGSPTTGTYSLSCTGSACTTVAASSGGGGSPGGSAGNFQTNNGGGGFAGQSDATSANQIFGLKVLRAKLAATKAQTANTRICTEGDSTTFGSWSTFGNSTSLVASSYPTFLSNILNNTYGIPSVWNGFIGDGGSTETFGAFDTRIVLGGFAQDTATISLGGATFKTTMVAGTAMTFTPTTNVDTFRILYITQSGGGILQAQIDSETPVAYNTAGAAGVVPVNLVSTVGVGAHTLKFTMSAGTQVNLVGVSESYDSTSKWLNVVNMGWPLATSSNLAGNSTAYSPASPSALAALGCDEMIVDIGINNWRAGSYNAQYATDLQTIATAQLATGDLIFKSPVPSATSVVSQAIQQQYVNAMQTVAAANGTNNFINNFARWQSYVYANGLGYYNSSASALFVHPDYLGYRDVANGVASFIAATPSSLTTNTDLAPTVSFADGRIYPGANPHIAGDPSSGFYGMNSGDLFLQVGGIKQVEWTSTAMTVGNASLPASLGVVTTSSPGMSVQSTSASGAGLGIFGNSNHGYDILSYPAAGTLQFYDISYGSHPLFVNFGTSQTAGEYVATAPLGVLGWVTSGTSFNPTVDTGLSRDSAGVIDVGTGAQGSLAGSMQMVNLTLSGKINFAAARKGTFVCTAGGTISVSNTNEVAASDVVISLNTAGGTISTGPAIKTVTPGTGLSVLCGAADTSTYNYNILN